MSTTTAPQTITDYAATRIEYITRHGGPRRRITAAEWNAYRYATQYPDTRDTRTYRQETGSYAADARHIRRGLDNAQADRQAMEAAAALDGFTCGYATALIWTATVSPADPDGELMTVEDAAGLAAETVTRDLERRIMAAEQVRAECAAFIAQNWADLDALIISGDAPSWEYHGHDYGLTRAEMGVGFDDRGYSADVAERLTDAAEADGNPQLEIWEDDDAAADRPHNFRMTLGNIEL